jgi:hypothetical protein
MAAFPQEGLVADLPQWALLQRVARAVKVLLTALLLPPPQEP